MLSVWWKKLATNRAAALISCVGVLNIGVAREVMAGPALGAFYIEARATPLPEVCLRNPLLRCDRAIGVVASLSSEGGLTLISAKPAFLNGLDGSGGESAKERKAELDGLQATHEEAGIARMVVLGALVDKAIVFAKISTSGSSFMTESIEVAIIDENGQLQRPSVFGIVGNVPDAVATQRRSSDPIRDIKIGCGACYPDWDSPVPKAENKPQTLLDIILTAIRVKLGDDVDAISVTTAFGTRPDRLTFGVGRIARSNGNDQNVALFVEIPLGIGNQIMVPIEGLMSLVVTDLSDDLRKISGSNLSLVSASVNVMDGRVYFIGSSECPKSSAVSCQELSSIWSVGLAVEAALDPASLAVGRNLNNSLFRVGMIFPQIVFDRDGSAVILERFAGISSQQQGASAGRRQRGPVTIRLATYKQVKL